MEQFETEVEKLQFKDGVGRCWMLGAQSGKWYFHDGTGWKQAEPPRPAPARREADDTTRVLRRSKADVSAPIPAVVLPGPNVRTESRPPTALFVGCGILAVLALVFVAVLAIVFLRPEGGPIPTPTHVAVMPLPDSATITPTPAPAIMGEATATLSLASDTSVLLGEADALMLKGQYADAAVRYQRAAELQPALAGAYSRWARALRLNYPPQPEEALAKAIVASRLDPENAEALTELALDNLALGRAVDAISAAERATNLDPRSADAQAAMGEIFLDSGRLEEGAAKAQLAVQLNASSVAAHQTLGHALVLSSQGDLALAQFQAVVTLEPQVAGHYVDLGTHLRRLSRFEDAIQAYETAISIDPGLAAAYDGLGRAYFSGPADYDKAIAAFDKAMDLAPQLAAAHSGAGWTYVMKGDGAKAVAAFQAALGLAPDLQEAKDGLARAQSLPAQVLAAAGSTPEAGADGAPPAAEEPTPKPIRRPAATKAAAAPAADAGAPAPAGKAGEPAADTPGPQLPGRIIYPVFHNDQASYDVYLRPADGSGGEDAQFIMGQASQPAASWDGKMLALRSWKRDNRGIAAMDLAGIAVGGNYHRLTDQSFMEDAMPAFSPDGGTVVFESRRDSDRQSRIYVAPTEGGHDHTLVVDLKPVIGITPNWLKNNQIIYSGCTNSGTCGLITVGAGGGEAKALTDQGSDQSPAGSPDGKRIAFMSQRGGNWDIFVMDVDGGNIVQLTQNRADDGLPAWSPDGNYIAYASNDGGVWGIWAIGADGSNPHKIFNVAGSIDGRVSGEDENKSKGWTEERLAWIP